MRTQALAQKIGLTSFISGQLATVANEDLNFLIGSPVPVGGQLVQVTTYDTSNPYRIVSTKRAPGGKAVKVETGGTTSDVTLELHGMDAGVDLYQTGSNDGRPDEGLIIDLQRQGRAAAVTCALGRLDRVLTLASSSATSGTGIDSTDTATDVPDLINQSLLAIVKACGGAGAMMNFHILWGPTAFRKCAKHTSFRSLINGGATKGSTAAITNASQLDNGFFMFPCRNRIATSVKTTSAPGASDAKAFLLDTDVYVFAQTITPTTDDPSWGKLLQFGSDPITPSRFYLSEDQRQEYAAFDWSEKMVATNTAAIYKHAVT